MTIAKSHRKFGQTIALAEHRLKIKHTSATASSLRELKLHALALQRQSLLAQDAGKFYKRLVPPDGAASYILSEKRPIARLRARLRLNRPAFNQSLFTRQLSPTAKCPFCGFIEDVEHVLLECYAYDSARHALSNALWSLVADTKHANAGWSLLRSLHGVRALSGEAHVPPLPPSDEVT